MEIRRVLDAKTAAPILRYHGALTTLARELLAGQAIIFLGAGSNVDAPPALPTGAGLSRQLAADCGLEWHEYIPLSTIAFYYESFFSRAQLNAFLREKLDTTAVPPSATIRGLIEVVTMLEELGQRAVVVTTNYDQQFERAYEARLQRRPDVIVYNGGSDPNDPAAVLHPAIPRKPLLWMPSKPTMLYKMHGCISQPGVRNLVVTEEDYINFLSNALSQNELKYLLPHVLARIASSTILFVGYSLADWNFRVIFKATAERGDSKSFAVQRFTPRQGQEEIDQARWDTTVDFWSQKSVDILNLDGSVFVADLLKVMKDVAPAAAR